MVQSTSIPAQNQFIAPHLAMKRLMTAAALFLFIFVPFAAFSAPSCKSIFQQSPKERYIVEAFKNGSKDFDLASQFANKVKSLSEKQREAWLKAIGSSYRTVPKKDPTMFVGWHIGGRRLLDRSLTLIERYDQKFAAAVSEGQTPRQAYAQFLDYQKRLFKTDYGEAEITQIVTFLKNDLGILQKQQSGPAITLLLAGSFINGKAHMKDSDIDMSLNNPKLVSEIPRWQKQINTIFSEKNIESKLTLEPHAEPEFFYGKINPVVLRVTAVRVEIIVFPPATKGFISSQLDATQPTIYVTDW